MFKKNAILKYESSLNIYSNTITPARNHVPDWYKKIPLWKNNEIFSTETGFNKTMKHCIPFLDSFTIGYMITLPWDIYVNNEYGVPYITWNVGVTNPPKVRKDLSNEKIVPAGHYPLEFTWDCCVSYSVPSNYNILFTHPINRYDLPFTTLSGVIDGNFTMYPHANVPFFIKEGFEGIIPQGTPIAQIIPFRQENWFSKKTEGLVEEGLQNNQKSSSLIFGWYKKTFWTQKKYL
jgi:hypothetical protein